MTKQQIQISQLQEQIESLERLRGVLDEEVIESKRAELQDKLELLIQTQGGAYIGGSVNTQGGDFAGRDQIKIEGSVYLGLPPQDATEALAIYRRVLYQTTASLPLRGVDVGASDPTAAQKPLGLTNIYVDLDTTNQVEVRKRKTEPRERPGMLEERQTRPLPALEAFAANRHLVLLGEPGGGKTTFVRFLAHCLAAHGLEPQTGCLKNLPGLPKREANLLPIPVILRDFALFHAQKVPPVAEPRHLWEFIRDRLHAQNLDFAEDPLRQCLEKGQALVLLDGLDEITTLDQRRFVRDAVRAFIARYPGNRYLITCRVLTYQPPQSKDEPDLRLTELPDFTLALFDEEKIDRFIQAWYTELARVDVIRGQDAPALTDRLQVAIRRPDLWRLAPNPLLLTVIALVHTHKGRLPEARALLYEETVEILLWRWEQVKLGGQEQAPLLRQLLLAAGRSEVDLKRILWELAFEAQAGSQVGDDTQLADIGQYRLQKALAALKDDDHNWARQVIEVIKLRAGLLIERSPEVFTFPHRTFQEYLAGAHLSTQANFASRAVELADQEPLWREVILLAVGKLVYLSGDLDKPMALVGELCPSRSCRAEADWRRAWLAGDVLAEMGVNRVGDTELGRDLLERVQSRLADLIQQGKLAADERARAGDSLAILGDSRFDSKAWHLPNEPLLGFVQIPSGRFVMGSDPMKDTEAFEEEQPQHEIYLAEFYIARYPVTVAQFQAFVAVSGYQPADQRSLTGIPNHPVARVTWYDALAYCRWLEEQLRTWSETPEPLASLLREQDWRVSLPSEAQWEKAARGADERVYPWGDELDPEKANYAQTGLGRTIAVGSFPGGASPHGLLDLSGNVFEWTRSIWGKYPYPEKNLARAVRENLEDPGNIARVLRGGSFYDSRGFLRCAFRGGDYPDRWGNYFGFRVVVSPANSGL